LNLTRVATRAIVAILTLINSLSIAGSISGETFKTIQAGEVNWRRFVPLFLVITALQFLVLWLAGLRENQVALKEGSRKFIRFFSGWYRRQGEVSIYCNDLAWLEGAVNEPILNELKEKAGAGRLEVFIRKVTGPALLALLDAGAETYLIPDEIKLRIRMSVRENDGAIRVIIRTKRLNGSASDDDVAIVRSTTDPYWCALALETFALCRRGRRVQPSADGLRAEVVP
jgi:hypothetical protein